MTTRVGWGLIGASNIARQRLARAITDSAEGDLLAVMSHRLPLAQALASQFAITQVYDDLTEMLRRPEITAVYVSSTNQHHHGQVLAAAASGKHVLCEKPLAMSITEALDMLRACRSAGVLLGVNHHLRNSVAIQAMRDALQSGSIGAPQAALLSQPVYVAEDEWRRKDSAAGAGVAFDVLVHAADAIRYILGDEPVEVCALARSSASMAPSINDCIAATYRFEGGTLASLYADFNAPEGRTRIEIHGREGSLFGYDVLGKTPSHRGRVVVRRGGIDTEIAVESHSSRYLAAITQFNAAVLHGGAPSCSGVDGVRSLAMILAAESAAASGKTERLSRAGLDAG